MKRYVRQYSRFEIGFLVAVSHLFFLIIIQLENYFMTVKPLGGQVNALMYVGELQYDNIVFAIFLGVLTYILAGNLVLNIILYCLVILVNLYLVMDQIAFKIFFDHLRPELLEGTAGLDVLISSTIAEIDQAFYWNIIYWFLSSVFIFFVLFSRTKGCSPVFSKNKKNFSLYILPASVLTLLYSVDGSGLVLNQHPLIAFTSYSAEKNLEHIEAQVSKNTDKLDIYKNQYDVIEEDLQVRDSILAVESRINLQTDKPNIVLIVLESVGSVQLLTDQGLPSKNLTPVIYQLSKNAVIFDSMYSVYPATVLSHVSMNTGGPTITLGNVYKDLSYVYKGPTLNKGLSALGYQTSIFSSQKMDYGNLDGFYKKLGYDTYFDFGEAEKFFQKNHALHSWGGEEFAIMDKAIAWVDGLEKLDEPFFLHYLSNATHHPYSVPENFSTVVSGNSNFEKYQNALAYTDEAVGRLIQYLTKTGKLENTIIVIVGDHGEAFSKRHAKNITHKNYLYEENVKNFMIISNSRIIPETIISRRISTIGDVMPTLLSFANAPQIFLPAQNILSAQYESRIAYFHKNSPPNLWGLRDGRWKYIDTRLGSHPQLYNLAVDPLEKNNLSVLEAQKISKYRQLASKWYVTSNNQFLSRLQTSPSVVTGMADEARLQHPGPRDIIIGYRDGNQFVAAKKLLNTNVISGWISWISYPKDKQLKFEWTSPVGKKFGKKVTVRPGWADTVEKNPAALPLEIGEWKMGIYDNEKLLISKTFIIYPDT